jgi:hypothetical protein
MHVHMNALGSRDGTWPKWIKSSIRPGPTSNAGCPSTTTHVPRVRSYMHDGVVVPAGKV